MIKIVIADDHQLTREGLKNRILNETVDMKIMDEASNATELLNILSRQLPNLVVLDISMPGKSGLDVLKEIKSNYPKVEVLVLSMYPEERYAVRMFRAGASGYLPKDKENLSRELIKAIRQIVIQKRRYISKEVADQLADFIHESGQSNTNKALSDREFQVLCMIASGKKIREIADELSITIQTVHTYRSRIMEKLNLKTNVDLTKYALQNNLIE